MTQIHTIDLIAIIVTTLLIGMWLGKVIYKIFKP